VAADINVWHWERDKNGTFQLVFGDNRKYQPRCKPVDIGVVHVARLSKNTFKVTYSQHDTRAFNWSIKGGKITDTFDGYIYVSPNEIPTQMKINAVTANGIAYNIVDIDE